jgi:hypothetical protein
MRSSDTSALPTSSLSPPLLRFTPTRFPLGPDTLHDKSPGGSIPMALISVPIKSLVGIAAPAISGIQMRSRSLFR